MNILLHLERGKGARALRLYRLKRQFPCEGEEPTTDGVRATNPSVLVLLLELSLAHPQSFVFPVIAFSPDSNFSP